jgi:intracellular multiplication protein IcmL
MDSTKTTTGYSGPYRGRNDYYRDGAHTLMFIVNFQAVVMALLTIALAVYFCSRESNDRYYAATFDGKAIPLVARSYPNMGNEAISDWAANAASEIMTFGFNDIDVRFAQSRKNFTADGWESFRKGVIQTKLDKAILDTQQISAAVPLSPPILKQVGLINGKYGWAFDVPLLITFRAGSDIRPVSKTVHMVITTVSTRENPYGVGINEWNLN